MTNHSGTLETFYRTEDRELLGISTLTPTMGRTVATIDFLSMDIAGALALAGLDIDRFKPAMAVIEPHGYVTAPFWAHDYERIE